MDGHMAGKQKRVIYYWTARGVSANKWHTLPTCINQLNKKHLNKNVQNMRSIPTRSFSNMTNVHQHWTKQVKETLETLRWDIFPHLLYSPDIAPSIYYLLRSIQRDKFAKAVQLFCRYRKSTGWLECIKKIKTYFFHYWIRSFPESWT